MQLTFEKLPAICKIIFSSIVFVVVFLSTAFQASEAAKFKNADKNRKDSDT